MDLVWFLLVGLVAGWLAGLVLKKDKSSLVKNLIVGVIGAFLGGWLFPLLGVSFAGLVGSILMATGGAIVLLFVLSKL